MLRWAAPLAAIAVVAGGTFGVNTLADADPGLPSTTPEQLVTDVLTASVPGMSGTVSSTVQLGLPDLGGLTGQSGHGGSDGPSALDWLSGTHTMRVWQSGEDKQRVSVPDGDTEYGVYRDGRTTWLWSSAEKKATKIEVTGDAQRPTGSTPPTPQEAAKKVLTEVGTTSTVSLATNVTVAGRSAYELVITPNQAGTKVGKIEIAVDGATKTPLRLEVFGAGATSASVSIGFTAVDFSVPTDSVFAFTAPPGTTVETKKIDASQKPSKADQKAGSTKGSLDHEVVGSGWLSVVVASGLKASDLADQPAAQQVLATLPRVKGAWGSGVLFEGPLFSAVLTDDGRVAVGAVVSDQLYAALG